MIIKKSTLIIVFCCIAVLGNAQQKKSLQQFRFSSIGSAGLVNGNNATSGLLQTVNGFRKGPLYIGVGVGLDYYLYRTVPLFADFRYEFGRKKNKPFIYADGGVNFEWVPESNNRWFGESNDYKNGYYTDAGIGFASGFKSGNAFIVSLGFSRKTLEETYTYTDWRTGNPLTDISTFQLNRVLLKFGFQFR